MKRWILVVTLMGACLPASTTRARGDELGDDMAAAASRFLAALEEPKREQASFAFDSPERFNWHWIPRERKGLPIKELSPPQRALAFGLLNTGLSRSGMVKATTIMSLEEILKVDEHGTGPVRDPELYFVSIFGTPKSDGLWGWRIEGHHLALNFTLKDGKVVGATPFMLGSNPAEVRSGARKGLRNLVAIETPANTLFLSLKPEQRKLAVVAEKAPEVTTTPNSQQAELVAPEGIAVDRLDADQKKALFDLLRAYASTFPSPIREEILGQAEKSAGSLHVAWYGPVDLKKPHAFRVQGSTVYIDFNDTQNDTNHIHTFYRSLLGDFGVPTAR